MNDKVDEKHSQSQPSVNSQNQGLELSPRQTEIYRNLEAVGPEIAAFYLDGVRTLQNKDLETTSYLLAHIAREIEGGLRDVLSVEKKEDLEFIIETPDGNKSTYEKGKEGRIEFVSNAPGIIKVTYNRIGKHKPSILQSLGVEENHPTAERWFSVAKSFAAFVHRHGAWKPPRSREVFVPLWQEFEEVLIELVGTHFKLLDRIDRLLEYKEPTKEIIKTLPNLLASKVRYNYFFNKLDSPAWLEPLKDAGWFHPDRQPISQETPPESVHFWYALGYVEKVAIQTKEAPCEETINILADIVNTIVNYTHDTETNITSDHTVSQVIKILCTLPIERIESQHITFIGMALKSKIGTTLLDAEIGETVLPKLLDEGADKLILELLVVMLDSTVINGDVYPVMQEYWLRGALNEHGNAIGKICGIGAAQIGIAQICNLIDEGTYSFNLIQEVEISSSDTSHEDYAEILVNFVSCVFKHAKSDRIADTVQELLNESHEIIRRIAINVIKNHYDDLKYLFWDWQGNPLEETLLKPELYQLIETNCTKFNETEIKQILHWIESKNYTTSAEDKETRTKQIAYRKRGWLSALLETGDKRVISLYQKYEQINPAKLERPGLLWWTHTWSGDTSPITVNELSNKSNIDIVNFLNEFKDKGTPGPSVPTEEGLRKSFEECVTTYPEKFTHDLQPFSFTKPMYQYSLLQGFLHAWRNKEEFDWRVLLKFTMQILSSKQFWDDSENGFDYKNWILSTISDLIAVGTEDDDHAFDVDLLPFTEEILLILVEKVKADKPIIMTRGGTESVDLAATFLNTATGKVYKAIINYALRFARTKDTKQEIRWPESIKKEFTKRLDRNIEPSIEFSFALGAYLANLLYLEKAWVNQNIDRIFPQQNQLHWKAAFSGYLFYSRQINKTLYNLLKEHKHYLKALETDFGDELKRYGESESLIAHICIGWIEDWEKLNDETSLIYQVIYNGKPNLLSATVHFFWKERDNLPEKMKVKVRPTWSALYESLTQKTNIAEYQDVLSRLSGWVALVDKIDAEVIKWLKFSVKHIKEFSDSAFFVEDLLPHVTKTPAEVGLIYLDMLSHNVYPIYNQEHIQEIVRILYNTGHQDVADRICNLYGEAGFDFLRSLYDENQN